MSQRRGFTSLEVSRPRRLPFRLKRNGLLTGFTLIELLVVIAIIGMLSTIAVVALNSARAKGRDAKRIADIRQMQTGFELYATDRSGRYPPIPGAGGPSAAAIGPPGTLTKLTSDGFNAATGTTLISPLPRDPGEVGAPDGCIAADPDGCDYTYSFDPALSTRYEIRFFLESGAGNFSKGLTCASEVGIKSIAAVGACAH